MIPDNSNWLLTNKILIGGLPQDKKAFNLIKDNNISVFINLMRTTEYQSKKKKPLFDYRDNKNRRDVEYYNYQITDNKTLSDEKMLNISRVILKFVEQGKNVYIHCLGGHGRTGVVSGIILHLKYPNMTYFEILKKLQERHKTRKYSPNSGVPQSSVQFNQLHRIITGKDDILFYDTSDKNFIFSNLYYRPKKEGKAIPLFTVGKKSWYSSEAYFQSKKFVGSKANKYDKEYANMISKSDTGGKAFFLGRMKASAYPMKVDGVNLNTLIKEYKCFATIRDDWDDIKDIEMAIAVLAKFSQNEDLFKELLKTGDKKLVEYSPKGDKYWATFWDKKGKNKLGKLLMKIRTCLKPHKKIILNSFK
jgi:ribA/ribD-fused uncharacterized protein